MKWSRERLHKQGFSGVGEDVKKRLRLLSEERLSPREEKPCGFVRHFHFLFKMKMAACFFIATHHSEQRFELKNSEFRCEMKF